MSILLCFLIASYAIAVDEVIKPLGRASIEQFLTKAPQAVPKHILGKDNAEGAAMMFVDHDAYQLYEADLDNKGESEFILTYISSGVASGSGIESVWQKQGKELKKMDFSSLLPKRTHLHLAKPFLVKRNSKIIMRFNDPTPTNKNTEYKLEGKKLLKL